MSRRLVILGAGGHAKMVIEAARTQGLYQPCVCLAQSQEHADVLGVPIDVESQEKLRELLEPDCWALVAVGSNKLRAKLTANLVALGYPLATVISAQAWVSPSASIGDGSVVMPGAIVGASVRVGQGAIINTASSVDHDCCLGEFVHIAPGSHLAGNVSVGSNAFLGVGVSVIPERRIGAGAIVGAGAVVVRDVPDHETWVGCPARCLKSLA